MNSKAKSPHAIPNALRKAMVNKFAEFDQYQLGKCFHCYRRSVLLAKYNKKSTKLPKKFSFVTQSIKYPTLKSLIRLLHISEPASNVMSLLGKPYPSEITDFYRIGLEGEWQPELAGTRMHLPVPYTWETTLSNTPYAEQLSAWEALIGRLTLSVVNGTIIYGRIIGVQFRKMSDIWSKKYIYKALVITFGSICRVRVKPYWA